MLNKSLAIQLSNSKKTFKIFLFPVFRINLLADLGKRLRIFFLGKKQNNLYLASKILNAILNKELLLANSILTATLYDRVCFKKALAYRVKPW